MDSSDAIGRVLEDYIVGWREGDSAVLSRVFELDILAIDVTDDRVATAELAVVFGGGTYVDHLTLYKVGESWKIVAKTFAVRQH